MNLLRALASRRRSANVLTVAMARLAAPVETGTTSSAVKLAWGCGHSVWRVNGDCLYATCPICYTTLMETAS